MCLAFSALYDQNSVTSFAGSKFLCCACVCVYVWPFREGDYTVNYKRKKPRRSVEATAARLVRRDNITKYNSYVMRLSS